MIERAVVARALVDKHARLATREVHNRRVTHEHLKLIERTRKLLQDKKLSCATAGAAREDAIAAAEEALGCTFPPSYRAFLREVGGLSIPARISTIHCFIGLEPSNGEGSGLVERTQTARTENKLPENLIIVGLGAQPGEWYCLDVARVRNDGEGPVFLFDARDNQLDQQFYDDFAAMVTEVLSFVIENLEDGADLAADDTSDETSLGGMY